MATEPPSCLGGDADPTSPVSGCCTTMPYERRGLKPPVNSADFIGPSHDRLMFRLKLRAPDSGLPSGSSTVALNVQPGSTVTSHLIEDRKSTRLNSSHLGISYAV